MNIDPLVTDIKQKATGRKPFLVAIEGFGGSGKSTLAAKLSEALGDAYVVNIDDFFIAGKLSDAEKSNFDRRRLEQEVLLPARSGEPISYQKPNELVTVPDVKYLIIEGVSSCHPDITHYFDYKVWVEVPKNVAKSRGNQRDKQQGKDNKELWEMWTDTYAQYKRKYHPEQQADFHYDNSQVLG